jgi:acetyltransferase-like isoleucine patch superfamily enzyme
MSLLVAKIRKYLALPSLDQAETLSAFYWKLKPQFLYRRFFGSLGKGSCVLEPMRLRNVQNIFLGSNVLINRLSFLLTLELPGKPAPRLTIGDGTVIGHFSHITCVGEVTIGEKVLTADKVHISDNTHTYDNPSLAILDQPVASRGNVVIGDGTWIGENVSILSCHIGRNCVIGSNSVVVSDVPDYSIAAGVPARVIRHLDFKSGTWDKIQPGHEQVSVRRMSAHRATNECGEGTG